MLSRQSLKEILELVGESEGSFIILEKDRPKLAVLDFSFYENLVNRAETAGQNLPNVAPQQQSPLENPREVLVTGGQTPLGKAVSEALTRQGDKVILLENDELDALVLNEVFENNNIDAVLHLAETSGHGDSLAAPEKYFVNNVEGGTMLLKTMLKHDVRQVVFRSSFASPSVYSQSKFLFENILNFYHQSFGVNSVSLRLPRIAGTGQNTEDAESLLFEDPLTAVLKTASGEISCLAVPQEDSLDGSPMVEVISIEDAVGSLIFALAHLKNTSGSMVYSVPCIKTTVNNLIEEVMAVTSKMIPTTRAADSAIWAVEENTAKSLSDLGFKLRENSLNNLIKKYWLTDSPAEEAAPNQSEPAEEPVARQQVPEVPGEPVSLSDLLSGKFTPFIKPHNS